jgi:signal transduction histidine kinase
VLLSKTLRSSTLRLAFIYIALFAVAILSLFGYVYCSTRAQIDRIADREIEVERSLFAEAHMRAGRDGVAGLIGKRSGDRHFEGWLFLLADHHRHMLAGNLTAWPDAARGDAGRADIVLPSGAPARAAYWTLAGGERLLIGRRSEDLGGLVHAIEIGLAWAIGLLILLAAAAGISTSRRSVSRIETINATSRRIMQAGLGQRIPKRGTGDEWDELSDNLNSMLDRIEELVAAHREVSDNIAHDLRTPLTRMRGRLERATVRPLEPAQYQGLIGDTIAELDGILRTFASLLRISQIEAHERNAGFRTIELAALAREVVELFDAAAEEHGVRLELSGEEEARVNGDRDLLFEAVANLIDNALKHGGGGGRVTVCVAPGEVAVSDRGPGIPAEERKSVLQRFYRLERSRSSQGNGLGLALVAAVAGLHGARLEMADNHPGLRIALRFPAEMRQPEVLFSDD